MKIKIIITDASKQGIMTGKTSIKKKLQEFLAKEDGIKLLKSGVDEIGNINGIKTRYDYLIIENGIKK